MKAYFMKSLYLNRICNPDCARKHMFLISESPLHIKLYFRFYLQSIGYYNYFPESVPLTIK